MNKSQLFFACEMRAKKDDVHGNFIEGLPIVYDSKTDIGMFDEIIERGALDKTDLKDVRFLVNHNVDMIPLARSRNNNENSTMQMQTCEQGLKIRVNLDTENNADAKSLYSAIERGDISGMSFMFGIDGEKWEKLESEHPTRRITSIAKVFEVSAVTFPAYDATEISARSESTLENVRKSLESVKNTESELELIKLKNKILGGF